MLISICQLDMCIIITHKSQNVPTMRWYPIVIDIMTHFLIYLFIYL